MPPCPFIYSEQEFNRFQAAHEIDDAQWQRECSRAMWANSAIVICGCIGGVVAGIMGPQLILSAIMILR